MLCPRTGSSCAGVVSSLTNRLRLEKVQKNLSGNGSAGLRKRQMQVSPSLLQILNLKIDFFYLDSGITCKTLRYILLEIVEVPRQLCLV